MGFSFFSREYNLFDSPVFRDATDWHCHILPGVDDGIATMQDALDVLAYYEQIGIKEVWLTPHILEDIPNSTQFLRERYSQLKAEYKGGVRLCLAAENMLDNLFDERLAHGDVLPLGPNADHLLVELSYMQPPAGLTNIFRKIIGKGLCPVLAHPERYSYLTIDDFEDFKAMGVKLQLNTLSLIGVYGTSVMRKARTMLSRQLYDICGTDLHSLKHFQSSIMQKKLTKEFIQQLTVCSHTSL